MLKTFPIEFVRQILDQTMYEQHLLNPHYFGGENQINISSFYQQLKNQQEVDRFVECFRDLTEQQNRTGLIGNGIIMSPENPTITNLYSCLIVPMTWTCSMRCTLENRDQMLETINNVIKELKGRKVDIAQLNCVDSNGKHYAQPFVVGTIGENDGEPTLESGNFIGSVNNANAIDDKLLTYFSAKELSKGHVDYLYCEHDNLLKVAVEQEGSEFIPNEITVLSYDTDDRDRITDVYVKLKGSVIYTPLDIISVGKNGSFDVVFDDNTSRTIPCRIELSNYELVSGQPEITLHLIPTRSQSDDDVDSIDEIVCDIHYRNYNFIEDDGTYDNVIFPPEHTSFEKYKVSLSFESLRCDTPNTLNAQEYCEISFGGSATLVNKGVRLGNDLIKIAVSRYGLNAQTPITYSQPTTYWLEPLELPSGSNANTKINQLVSNSFLSNTHTDALSLVLQYTFICDMENDLIKQWFNYARYGTQNISSSYDTQTMTPNLIYNVKEIWSSWGDYETKEIKTKIIESIDIENTEGDTLTLSLTMQIQGDND